MERVFLSSTSRDLEEHRKAVLGVLMRSENFPEAMEWFGALPGEPVEVCLEKVRRSDALVLIVAHRYGWVPAQNDGGKGNRSITWLETEEAVRCGKPRPASVRPCRELRSRRAASRCRRDLGCRTRPELPARAPGQQSRATGAGREPGWAGRKRRKTGFSGVFRPWVALLT
jgi:hypothetical protein